MMELGMIGLGRMGAGMSRRLHRAGVRVVGYDPNPEARARLAQDGIETVDRLEALVAALKPSRTVWLMVPAGDPVDQVLAQLAPLLAAGDLIVEGGNSYYRDTLRRAETLQARGLLFADVGVSGGLWGEREGYGLMAGGPPEAIERLRPILERLAPGPDRGWVHAGPVGAGHFVKMVHNGIEYALMQAYAEGFALLKAKAPFQLDLAAIAEAWRHGTIIRSFLLDLIAGVLREDAALAEIAPVVADSGEGRWTVQEAVDLGVPVDTIAAALFRRFASQDPERYGDRLLAALRHAFGGHPVQRAAS
ncbi:MAG: decarboxylating 6-phosphogluconate dehydrogenase [Rhodothermus marinus]|nr:decarboxylating 6-phosphogluconate dehydrogenase [Rhodothermus marinus]